MSSNSPCAACKLLRRKCTQECVFAPYFPPDQPQKFANVHKVFGASNVAKLLNDLPAAQREDAVNSLFYEADARLRDPVYGCVGLISILQHKLKQIQMDLFNAKKELSTYIGPSAMLPMLQAPGNFMPQYQQQQAQMMSYNIQQAQTMGGQQQPAQMMSYNMQQAQMMGGLPPTMANPGHPLVIQQQQHYQQIVEAQQMAAAVAAAREQELLRNYEQQQAALAQQQTQQSSDHLVMYDTTGQSQGQIPSGRFDQMSDSAGMAPELALNSYEGPYQIQQHTPNDHSHLQHQHHHELQATQLLVDEQQHGLALAEPPELDPHEQQLLQGLALGQPLQMDPQEEQHQQQQLQFQLLLQQHQDGSEEDGGSIGPGSIGPGSVGPL